MMMTETCQIWGTFLITISLLGLGLGNDICKQTGDLLQCDNCTKCEKEYNTTRSEQICNYTCKMDVGNETKDNGQTCKPTERCGMECGRDSCKKQKCGDQVDECKMYLGCSRGDFKQTCNATSKCNMTCSGDGCKEQKCEDQVGECAMHCIASSCKQECNARTCLMTRTWPICSKDRLICSGNGKCCGSLMPPSDTWTVENSITSTECDGESSSRCSCSKYFGDYCTISDLYSSNAVLSITATTTHVFATQISTIQGIEHSQTYTLLQSLSQSPLSLISPSPSPLPSSSSSSAGVSPAVASASLSAPSSSSPSSSSASLSPAEALASSLFAPSSLTVSLTPAETSVSSSEPSPLSSSLSLSLSSSSRAVLLSSSPSPSSSLSSSWPSPTETSRLSTTEALKKVANDSVAKLTGIEIRRNTSLKEAVRVFEDFTDQYLNITKSLKGKIGIMEDKIKRKSIFAVASAFENFVLKYGKYYLDGTKPSTNITSENMVLVIQKGYRESCSDLFFNEEEWQASINISSANFAQNGSVIAVCVYKGLHDLLLRNKSIGDEKHYSRMSMKKSAACFGVASTRVQTDSLGTVVV
ncbi:probable serine/threonine-protein kinase dyrk2 isoform X2 [Stylophora pistillata]|uniref:probable serine/threonine-protein kinase dyrk2 isoform X2 n=1 Tax=Stylophora pistillata TaxID=50429 RepID=UPI000C055D01|nr:probable serine/threonine-protein kinase dyrk2 isoform X2 [Stylophora pistillata]